MSGLSKRIAEVYLNTKMADSYEMFEAKHKEEDELIFRVAEADRSVTAAFNGYVQRMNERMESLTNKINNLKKVAQSPNLSIDQRRRLLGEYESMINRIASMK